VTKGYLGINEFRMVSRQVSLCYFECQALEDALVALPKRLVLCSAPPALSPDDRLSAILSAGRDAARRGIGSQEELEELHLVL
jgi:hypothetical protein